MAIVGRPALASVLVRGESIWLLASLHASEQARLALPTADDAAAPT